MKFTRDAIARLTLPEGKGEHFEWDDSLPGFGVRLRGGSKRWVVQYRFGASQRRESLGDVRKVTLEDARKIARNRFAQVELGTDPSAERAKAKAAASAAKRTLAVVADQYLAAPISKTGKVRRPNTQRALVRYLTKAWAPLRDTPIADIHRADVAKIITAVAKANGAPSASRARANLSALFAWAMKEGLCENNPVIATNDPGKGKDRDRVLSDSEIKVIWRACGDDDYGRIVRLLLLTGCRREEIGALKWSEVDLAAGTITIPGERTKNHRTHTLPLPSAALDLLPPPRTGRHVFGGRGGFSAWAYSKLQIDARIAEVAGRPLAPWVVHDLRRTMRTGLGKIGVPPHIAEMVINHVKGGVQAIYDRHKYEGEIKIALSAWADHVLMVVGARK